MAPANTGVTIRLTEPVISMIGAIEYERARARRRRGGARSARAQNSDTLGGTDTPPLIQQQEDTSVSRPTSPGRPGSTSRPSSRPLSQPGSRTHSPARGRSESGNAGNEFVIPGPNRGRSGSRGDALNRREESVNRTPRDPGTTTGSGTVEEAQAADEPPPAMLRGLLTLTLAKPSRIRDISIKLRGIARTDWPEGIGPRRLDIMEETALVQLSFTFFSASNRSYERRAASIGPGTGRETTYTERGRTGTRRSASVMPSREMSTGRAYQSHDSAIHHEEEGMVAQLASSNSDIRPHSILSRIPSSSTIEDLDSIIPPILPGESAPAYEAVPSNPTSPAGFPRISSSVPNTNNLSSDSLDLNNSNGRTHPLQNRTRPERSPTPSGSPLNPSSRSNTLTSSGHAPAKTLDGHVIQSTSRLTDSPPSSPLGRPSLLHGHSVGTSSLNQSSPTASVGDLSLSESDVDGRTGWNSAPVPGSTTSSFERGRPPARQRVEAANYSGSNVDEGDTIHPSAAPIMNGDVNSTPTYQSFSSQRMSPPPPARNGTSNDRDLDLDRSTSRASSTRTTGPSLSSPPLPSAMREVSLAGRVAGSHRSASKTSTRFSFAGMSDALKGKTAAHARDKSSVRDSSQQDRSNSRAPRNESPDARATGCTTRDQSRGRKTALKVLRDALTSGNDMENDNSDDEGGLDDKGKGRASAAWKEFRPGTYTYPISIPVPASLPPSISADFGHVAYSLKATVHRAGALTSNLSVSTEVTLVSCPGQDDIEENESIVVERFWETQMKYHVALSGKSFPVGGVIPIAIRLNPMAKIKLYRITAQLEQKTSYVAAGRKLTRHETPKKFPLLRIENKDPKSPLLPILSDDSDAIINHPLAAWFINPTSSDDTLPQCLDPIGPWHLESQLKLPECSSKINFSTAHERANIIIAHVLKIVLRVERGDDDFLDSKGRRKLWDVIIESPVHLLSCRCAQIVLPPYTASPNGAGPSGSTTSGGFSNSSNAFSTVPDCGYNHSHTAHRAGGPISITKTLGTVSSGGPKHSHTPHVAPVATLEQNLLFARLVAGEETPAGEVPPTYNAAITEPALQNGANMMMERTSSTMSNGTARGRSSSLASGDGGSTGGSHSRGRGRTRSNSIGIGRIPVLGRSSANRSETSPVISET